MILSIALLVTAAILGFVGYKIVAVRFGVRYWGIGIVCAAIAVALVFFVITSTSIDPLLDQAMGDQNWIENGFVRLVMVLGPPVVAGYWMWILYRSRYR